MGEHDGFGELADACLKAHRLAAEAGTPGMVALTQALLFLIGREAARRGLEDEVVTLEVYQANDDHPADPNH